MPIFAKKINVCKMCESSAGDNPYTFKSGEKICCLCDDCRAAIESLCKDIIKKELKEAKKKTTKKKTNTKKKGTK